MAIKTGQAEWVGDFKHGHGTMIPGSKSFTANFNYESVMGTGPGTNPTEILGVILAGCFSSMLAVVLAAAGYEPGRIVTDSRAHLEKVDGRYSITRIELDTRADVPGIEDPTFQKHVQFAIKNCPIGQAITAVEVIVDAKLAKLKD